MLEDTKSSFEPRPRGDYPRREFILLIAFFSLGALYFARVVFEPIAFMLFALALIWPLQTALEKRMPKSAALILTIMLTLVVISLFAFAIVWSISDVAHWFMENAQRLQVQYGRIAAWLEEHDIFITDLFKAFDASWLIGPFRSVAYQLNYFIAFSLVVFLLLMFGLMEFGNFRTKIEALDGKLQGWSLSQTCVEIAKNIRKYMFIRTLASLATGLAVFAFSLSIGLELAMAWGIISFVLNYIPYIGPLIAVALPVAFATAQFESWQMIAFAFIGLYMIQFWIGSYLEPLIAGNALSISPFVMLCAFFFWDFMWGIPGAFIGLPVTVAAFTICEQNPSTRWLAKLLSSSKAS
jgi:predicted PurR-regulated permease PerM